MSQIWILYFLGLTLMFATAEQTKNRFVVRAGTSFKFKCNREVLNATRATWTFAASNSINNETIFDSRSKGNTKKGFEFHCDSQNEPACDISLVEARKDNSGNYTCSIESGRNSVTNVLTIIELIVRGPTSMIMVVSVGDLVNLPCHHNIKNVTRALWTHTTLSSTTEDIYNMAIDQMTDQNYRALCKPHQLYCDLQILYANKESAGRYTCQHGDSYESEKRYGYDPLTYFIEIQLAVGELTCNGNFAEGTILLGENDCYGTDRDVLSLKCSFSYVGNTDPNLLRLEWSEQSKYNALMVESILSTASLDATDATTATLSIRTDVPVSYKMASSSFVCQLESYNITPCKLHKFKTQFVKNVSVWSTPKLHQSDLRNVKCSANKSLNVECSYAWFHSIGDAVLESQNAFLPAEHMSVPGTYTCIGRCRVRGRQDCFVKAMEIEVLESSSPNKGWIVAGLLLLVTLLVLLVTAFFLVRRYKKRGRKRRREKDKFEDSDMKINQPVTTQLEHSKKGSFSKKILDNVPMTVDDPESSVLLLGERNLRILKEVSLPKNVSSFCINRDKMFVHYNHDRKVYAYNFDSIFNAEAILETNQIASCDVSLTDVLDLSSFGNYLYVLGRYVVAHENDVKIYQMDKGLRCQREIFSRENRPGTCKLSKSSVGNILFAHFDNILILSTDGEINKTYKTASVRDAVNLRGDLYVEITFDDTIDAVSDQGDGLLKIIDYQYIPREEGQKIISPRCLAADKYMNVYVADDVGRKVFALNHKLEFICSLNVDGFVHKMCYDEEAHRLLCLIDEVKLLFIKLT